MPPDVLDARVGEDIEIRLAAAPSSGYGWEPDPLPAGVALVASGFETRAGALAPGSPIEQVFRLRAVAVGEHSLTFRYKRPWESSALQTKIVALVVRQPVAAGSKGVNEDI